MTSLPNSNAAANSATGFGTSFPSAHGLGVSSTARFYGIQSLDEAIAYLDHEVLGPRLRECVELMNTHLQQDLPSRSSAPWTR